MAYTAASAGPSTSGPTDASRTIVIEDAQPRPEDGARDASSVDGEVVGTLRLRAAGRPDRPRVAWAEEVVDNEGMGKKKSKICCIYHKPRRFDESSSEEDSSDSDSGSDGGAKPSNYRRRRRNRHHHNHDLPHDEDCNHGHHGGDQLTHGGPSSQAVVHELAVDPEPNAYERGPSAGKGKMKAHADHD
ncbi:hypothetical protein PUNSTDRAFT_54508 [Punctularia strigosozonata HHB-11173 SS5]|uniref:uncharacterized protein n=1 Tax=Punctularia strigosozonata (strain HHB-11173) TaxID=741275 RepID=UPI00044182D3|nr:uncharacterized protein PUNSTDRAFT_54508 [Punctularia strigosozonata HHB-11173 SS5]EIN06254.1 hypothetical protein PUNSTDRAFT_54508 [Punctularia strigosozonata HHB-11173 SS5]